MNKFDSPAQDRYFNTYVPLPYEQVMGTVAARQAQLQREQDMLNKTYEDTQNIKYIPGTKDEQYVRDYLSKAGNLVNKYYGSDLSDPIVKQQMRQEFNNMTNKPDLQNIQVNQAAWAANQKYKAELKAQGLYDPSIDEEPANANWDTVNGSGIYNYITSPYKNPRPAAETYFNNIKPTDLPSEGDYLMSGITRDKINQTVDTKWSEFSNTSEGNLYVKKIAKEQGLDYTKPEVRKQIATEYLKGVGEEYIHKNKSGTTLDAQVRAARDKKDKDTEYKNTTQEQTIRSSDTFDPYVVGKIEFNETGNVFVKPKYNAAPTRAGYGTISGSISAEEIGKEDRIVKESEQKAKLEFIRTKIPALKGLSDKDVYSAYRDITKDGKAFPDLPKIDLPNVPKTGLADYLADSMLDRSLMVMDDFGSSDLRTATDNTQYSPLQDLGYTTQSLKTELKKAANGDPKALVSIGGLAQNGPQTGMIQLEIQDLSKKGAKGSKGKVRKLYISTNEETAAIMAPANEIYNNIRNFQGGITPVGYDNNGNVVAARVTPDTFKDPLTGKWNYEYKLEEGYVVDGQFTPVAPTTMDRIKDMQMRRLTNSMFINTAMNYTKDTAPSF